MLLLVLCLPPVELIGLAVAVVAEDLDVIEHGLDHLCSSLSIWIAKVGLE
jgi:hypothetical protein